MGSGVGGRIRSWLAPPQKPAIFFNERFIQGCSTQGRVPLKVQYPLILLCAKVYLIDDVGVSRDTRVSGDTTGSWS